MIKIVFIPKNQLFSFNKFDLCILSFFIPFYFYFQMDNIIHSFMYGCINKVEKDGLGASNFGYRVEMGMEGKHTLLHHSITSCQRQHWKFRVALAIKCWA